MTPQTSINNLRKAQSDVHSLERQLAQKLSSVISDFLQEEQVSGLVKSIAIDFAELKAIGSDEVKSVVNRIEIDLGV